MNWSALDLAELAIGVVTSRSTVVPSGWAGAVATTWVAETEPIAAFTLPKATVVAPPRLDPLMVTLVPAGPDLGLTPLTTGS